MTLVYQSIIYAAGLSFTCVESYESLFERLRDSNFKIAEEGMTWVPPLEVTIEGKGEDGTHPIRCLIQPQAISAILEIPEGERREVEHDSRR